MVKGVVMKCVDCGEDKEFDEEGLFELGASKNGWSCRDCSKRGPSEVEW